MSDPDKQEPEAFGIDLKFEDIPADLARAFFAAVISYSRWFIGLGLLFIVVAGAGLLQLVKDPSTDSLIPPDHPSVVTRDYAEDVFGLRDPVVAAISTEQPGGIFTDAALTSLYQLHNAIAALENVRADRTISLVSEARIFGDADTLRVEPYLADLPQSSEEVAALKTSLLDAELIDGILISEDRSTALIVAELFDQSLAEETYRQALELAATLARDGVDIHIAGQGAVSGFLSGSIDRDSRKLPPICVAVIFLLIWLAFRSTKALLAPLFIIAATVAGAIGIMAWMNVPYFVITTSLPVILITIAVADTIHVLSGYYRRLAENPNGDRGQIIIDVMVDLWRPLTLTTFTTMAGFVGIGLASSMPPISYFGWFAALGVFLAWVFTLLVLPCVLAHLKPDPSPVVRPDGSGPLSGGLTRIAQHSASAPRRTLAMIVILAGFALALASQVQVERSQIENFPNGQPIRLADELINARLAGTSYLDLVIETERIDGLMNAARIEKIAELQAYAETLPFVQKSHSVIGVLEELHSALEPGSNTRLPMTDEAIGQYLLFYEAAGNPEDIEDEIDLDYQRALVRLYMNSRYTGDEAAAVEALAQYLESDFNEAGMTGRLSGRVNVDYHWMKQLQEGHLRSILISSFLVFVVATVLFRSVLFGALAIAPVAAAILGVYSVMGASGIFIEPATSMFAAISIGLGVDFAIHFTDRLQKGLRRGSSVIGVIQSEFPTSTRACFINAAALGVGFSVLMTSELPPIFKFGLLITIAAAASFVVGLIVISAIIGWLDRAAVTSKVSAAATPLNSVLLAAACLMSVGMAIPEASAQSELTGRRIAEKVYERDDGQSVDRKIIMELTDRRGITRQREAVSKRLVDDGVKKSVIVYTAPRRYRNVAFLSHDDQADGSERRWLFMPATGRPKQIPASDRGDYFLGTEFSYEDIRTELKFDLEDYQFEVCPLSDDHTSEDSLCVVATPTNASIASEVGYGRIEAIIDPQNWMPIEIVFDDEKGRQLKTVKVENVHLLDGIWTAGRIHVEHHQNGRQTSFTYADIAYDAHLSRVDFTPQGLKRLLN
ncbi:MAG: outer membrane lipoprotein-sorting protein [Henriciella sp.]|nr:outer membrane lipoprotein-sorting protein [Henriciella sp.]